MAVIKVLDCSTGHLSPAAREWLSECSRLNAGGGGSAIGCLGEHLYGWFMHAPGLIEDDEDAIDHGIPEDLHPVIRHARSLECFHILFDADADVIEGLQTYEF